MTETAGVDFSMARPTPTLLTGAGFRFVMGYVSNSPSKNLTAANVRDYRAAGLSVGLVWETTADRALAGAGAGAADGAAADKQADALGYPADCVIFFAVDQAVSLAQINGPIRAYATAFNAAMKRPAGVYGSFLVVDTLVTPGVGPVRYGWQTAAWSARALSPKAHIYQRATPSGHWPVIPGTDENVLCLPLPLFGATPTPTPGADMTPDELFNAPIVAADGKSYPFRVFIQQTNATAHAAAAQTATLTDALAKLQATVDKLAATPVPVAQAQQVVDELGKRLNTPGA